MEKKYYIIPTIKVKEMETESLMDGASIEVVENPSEDEIIDDGSQIQSKPMYGDFNVWEK
jgi:hypothetical protein